MKLIRASSILIVLMTFLIGVTKKSYCQCASPIISYPFKQDFESSDGSWTRSSSDHWQWGSLSGKQVITAAASGKKCWIAGGLSGSNYASGISYIQSPCFDFSSLSNPEVEFNIFWETEQRYDGANFQYSLDGGTNWTILGTVNSNANCLAVNWYNESSILKLNNQTGWSGSIQGGCSNINGSGDWALAKHNMGMLAGKSKVIFRFYFGAGNVCNDYDGFALDDFVIREAPPKGADFSFICQANNKVSFSNNSSVCITSSSWNFGDPASTVNNISSLSNPSHVFSGPGSYTVSLTAIFSDGTTSSIDKEITIINVNPIITNQVLCNGDKNGSIATNVSGGNGSYIYSWNTNPNQSTSSLSNLGAGTYTVTVTSLNSCPISSSVTLVEPDPISINVKINPETCNSKNGNIDATVIGGTGAFTYLWSNNESTAFAKNLAAGSYSLQVKDSRGCKGSLNDVVVSNQIIAAMPKLGNDTSICPGQSLLLNPGSFVNYKWQDNSTISTFRVNETGVYSVEVTNSAGCKGTDEIEVVIDCSDIYFPLAFSPNGDGNNDNFGPAGNIRSVRTYSLVIYNRWGQKVFETQNPLARWNGMFKNQKSEIESLVWIASYRINGGNLINKKGNIVLIR